ncbi:MAG TPA: Zn-ribbon domain-containing OB-fold protein [Candidatus Syntrophoarchaeum butanivorans]|uniref:3-hydroxybutyryl-CoA epimerase n=1 Tax=Candidatus Syntropharchaeum butanivorans TaxID=1839936 RepID=A0A1F2P528_9EURY|nr:MAG: 3-hydroxybutyryl-CoA epimerase [Candidatus Syntrophoarchaeum butanivorans]HDM35943.1 Zn-ribbon domain-containing OB-fold protein [Candidatus Syntrophoarchaeum butanivorans]HEC57679.1 Zn-ribbon domain-containing OB-fold protein [Candidatus Syntrophoarchaeum butanivorans]
MGFLLEYRDDWGMIRPFFEGLSEGRLYGTRCPLCEKIYCPPRAHCPSTGCNLSQTEWVELEPKGVLESYTILGLSTQGHIDELPLILGLVRVNGCSTCLMMRVEAERDELSCGARVEVRFREDAKRMRDLYAVLIG